MAHDLNKLGLTTRSIHAGQHKDPATGAVAPPLYQTSTFAFDSCGQGAARFSGEEEGYIYTRMGNPTIARLEEAVSTLEGGAGGLATGSGMAALCTSVFALLEQGGHIVSSSSVYGPSRVVIERDFSRFGVTATFVDSSDTAAVAAAMRPETKLVFVETPANPTLTISDLRAIADIAHAHGALLMVDNTFASPILQRPIEHGADVVMHSMTKFLNGHTDVVAGMIIPASDALLKRIRASHYYFGAVMDPHQAWLVLRGLRTLSLRVKASQANAMRVAEWLEAHPKVEWVAYPGLASHPQRELAARQMDGPGALMSFEVKGGVKAGAAMLDHVELMTLAVSLGGIETLIQHPASMTHAAMPREARLAAGITDGLVRVSVGCEDVEDLLADFAQALEHA
ncbi:MAG: methionine gamma-lyase [Deltaproteobacteria bacterium HGW-Deltaproteobacteria-14]|nr:MAG: methionine gamma-lyase [Deltaproteobacteria bacterium HGW-Deltaproteobacteria-14]